MNEKNAEPAGEKGIFVPIGGISPKVQEINRRIPAYFVHRKPAKARVCVLRMSYLPDSHEWVVMD